MRERAINTERYRRTSSRFGTEDGTPAPCRLAPIEGFRLPLKGQPPSRVRSDTRCRAIKKKKFTTGAGPQSPLSASFPRLD